MSNPTAVWDAVVSETGRGFHSFHRREHDYPVHVTAKDAWQAYADRARMEGTHEARKHSWTRCTAGVERGGLSIPEMTDGFRNPYPAVIAGGPACPSLTPDLAAYERNEQIGSGTVRDTVFSAKALRMIGRGHSMGEALGRSSAALGGGALDDGASERVMRRPFEPVSIGGKARGLRIADAFDGARVRSAPPAREPVHPMARPMLSEHSTVLHHREMSRAEATRRDEPVFGDDRIAGWPSFGGRESTF